MADDDDVKDNDHKEDYHDEKADKALLIDLLMPFRPIFWALRVLTGAANKQLEKLRDWYDKNR